MKSLSFGEGLRERIKTNKMSTIKALGIPKIKALGLKNTNDFGINNESENITFSINWYTDKERKNKTNNIVLGDTVFYTIFCTGIPHNTTLKLNLYDTDKPLGNTNLKKHQFVSVRNGTIRNSVFFGVEYFKFIENDIGNEIEIYWKTIYNGIEYDIFNTILNLQDDEYYRAINDDKYTYTCNCGWIDKSHFNTTTSRKRIDIGATNLWKQLLDEKGRKSVWRKGFRVVYSQDIVKLGISIGVTKEYFVKYGLSVKTKEQIALTIFQEVSMEFEQLQSLHPTSGSSFEPADLISNLLGFYSVIRPKLTSKFILENLCKEMSLNKSIAIYKKYPGTFTISKYKNRKFTPQFFENEYFKNPIFPKEFLEITPYVKDSEIFRDWIELFDIHNGISPIK